MIRIAEGIARKVSLGFIGVSFIGWVLFTAGYGRFREWYNDQPKDYRTDESDLYSLWAGSVIGPFVHILAIAHVLLWGLPSSVLGSVTAVLSIMYMSAIGYGLASGGIYINALDDDDNPDKDVDTGLKLIFAGGLVTTLFWALHLAFWPWFKKESDEDSGRDAKGYGTF